jgi:hypothetical protein
MTRWLERSSLAYLALSLLAAGMAVRAGRSSGFGGRRSTEPPIRSWLRGAATVVPAPLPWLVAQAACTALVRRRGWPGWIGTGGLAACGLATTVATLGEPVTAEHLGPGRSTPHRRACQHLMLALPVATTWLAIVEVARRRRERER